MQREGHVDVRNAKRTTDDDRRAFLKSCGRFASVTPPTVTMLLSTALLQMQSPSLGAAAGKIKAKTVGATAQIQGTPAAPMARACRGAVPARGGRKKAQRRAEAGKHKLALIELVEERSDQVGSTCCASRAMVPERRSSAVSTSRHVPRFLVSFWRTIKNRNAGFPALSSQIR